MRARISAPNDHCEREAGRLADRALRSPGPKPALREMHSFSSRPLDPATRAYFEPRFGHDFSRVRVHSDARAAESAQSLNALAYTAGTDVVFGSGQVSHQLLAHELAHVTQQSHSEPMIMRQTTASDAGAACSFTQHHKIEPAAFKAQKWVTQTLAGLDAFLSGAKTPAAQTAGAALDNHFHSTDRAVATYVRQRLGTIQTDMFGRKDLQVVCPPRSDQECSHASTGTALAAVVPNPHEIDFCSIFFERGEDDRASTIIHELGHAQLGLRADQDMIDRAYKDNVYYHYLTTGEALTNAESYAMFAREVATGSSPAHGFIPDTLRDCPDPWVPIISDAISKARMWNHEASKHTLDPATHRRHRFASAFIGIDMDLRESQSFKCVADGSSRCKQRGIVAYWWMAGDLRICPALVALPTPEQRALNLLASLYAYKSLASGGKADEAAIEAQRLHSANVPAAAGVLRP
jgi:hypothetical protein